MSRLDGGAARLDLYWHSTGDAGEDVFAHVLDCAGGVLGQRDGAALGGAYPLWLWPPGIFVHDVRHVPLSAPAGDCYRVEIGLFNPADGARTAAFGPDGNRLPNDAVALNP